MRGARSREHQLVAGYVKEQRSFENLLSIEEHLHGEMRIGDDGECARLAGVLTVIGEGRLLGVVALAFIEGHGVVVAFRYADLARSKLDGESCMRASEDPAQSAARRDIGVERKRALEECRQIFVEVFARDLVGA